MGCVDETLGGIDKSLNFRVDVDISKPLRRGIRTIVGGATIWIRLKYVKLPDFCYICGRLGHDYKSCEMFTEGMQEDDLQYGSWLRASPLKSRRRHNEAELQEERKLFTAYKNRKAGTDTRTKLVFCSPQEVGGQEGGGGGMSMSIDSEGVVVPEGDVSKRKLVETSRASVTEKVRVIEGVGQVSNGSYQRAEVAMQPRLGQ